MSKAPIALIIAALLSGCIQIPESCFRLAADSRLPAWFERAGRGDRADLEVRICYFIDSSGRTMRATLHDTRNDKDDHVVGTMKGSVPIQPYPQHDSRPIYELITVGATTELIEHRGRNDLFHVSDDPAMRRLAEEQRN